MRKAKIFRSSIAGDVPLELHSISFIAQANKPGAEIQPTMYGIFFEDINFGADGGLSMQRW